MIERETNGVDSAPHEAPKKRNWFLSVFGPRVPWIIIWRQRQRFILPTIFLSLAGGFLLFSVPLPYWGLVLEAPQYPDGLRVTAYLNKVAGDVGEIDSLNHYIGMRPLAEAAKWEKAIGIYAIAGFALLVLAALFIHSPWAILLVLPAAVFPAVFLGDMYFWMWNFGTHLDPTAALSSSIKPFVPPIIGVGMVGQFRTIAHIDVGFFCALWSSVMIIVGMFTHRAAFKPHYDAARGARESSK